MIPPGVVVEVPVADAAFARTRSLLAPPRKFGSPFSPTSVVAKTTLPAARAASMKALSSSASDGSLNWMSYAITLAPAAFSCLITSAWTRARERPLEVELVEGDVVDLHDGEVLPGRLLAPDREPRVDRVQVEILEDVVP